MTATSIELEMFEVGLGSSIYVRLKRSDGDVRILADGGVDRGYAHDHVQIKLDSLLREEGAERIDLIVGTHYDEDHLRGLVPIVASGIEVGELWLPPVADDVADGIGDVRPRRYDMLGAKFAADPEYVGKYVAAKRAVIERCRELEHALGAERRVGWSSHSPVRDVGFADAQDDPVAALRLELGVEGTDACHEDGCEHVDVADAVTEPNVGIDHDYLFYGRWSYFSGMGFVDPSFGLLDYAEMLRSAGESSPAAYSVARIRRAAAKDAINATALDELVQAAVRRGIEIRYHHIPKGRPAPFRWHPSRRRFLRGRASHAGATGLMLLGPSDHLIRKHAHRLPIDDRLVLGLISRIPVKSISPSNQLSYVVRVDHAEQRILICGDTGFSDFMASRTVAEPLLLAELTGLDVVQVAHHAGNNQWFYGVLIEAWRSRAAPPPVMLVSHAKRDRHRPNDQFADFVEHVAMPEGDPFVVFTSTPQPTKVAAFRCSVMPPQGTVGKVGDVRLELTDGRWTLARHAVQV